MIRQKDIDGVINWTRNYFKAAKIEKAVIGLSGGIDSAVVAKICCKALGPKNVIGAILPCQSQYLDELLAEELAMNLGIASGDYSNLVHLNLDLVFETLWKTYNVEQQVCNTIHGGPFPPTYNKLVPANAKPRLRMTALYMISSHVNGLVVGTANKTESYLGYVTKFGDGGVDIEPIQDFYKTEIFELARKLGDIPEEIIQRAPSAGLWDSQTDEEELGLSYEMIDKSLQKEFISGPVSHKIQDMIKKNKHKNLNIPYYKRS